MASSDTGTVMLPTIAIACTTVLGTRRHTAPEKFVASSQFREDGTNSATTIPKAVAIKPVFVTTLRHASRGVTPPCNIHTPNDHNMSCAPTLSSNRVRTPASPYIVSTMGNGRKIQFGIAARNTNVFFWSPWLNHGATSRPATYAMTMRMPTSNGANQPSRNADRVTDRNICVNTSAGSATSTTNRLNTLVVSAAR